MAKEVVLVTVDWEEELRQDWNPESKPWLEDKSAINWNLAGHKWGGILPQDLDLLKNKEKSKRTPKVRARKK